MTTPNEKPRTYVNVEVAERLIAELESGKYTQGRHKLKVQAHPDGRTVHCCLGVACELFMQETGRGEWAPEYRTRVGVHCAWQAFRVQDERGKWHRSSTGLPKPVQEWLGLDHDALGGRGVLDSGTEMPFPFRVHYRTAGGKFDGAAGQVTMHVASTPACMTVPVSSIASVNDHSDDYRNSITALRDIFMQPVQYEVREVPR